MIEEREATHEEQATPPILQVRNLTRHFATMTAVRDLSFDVERGSITGIVGPNGAGKTTTFLMLSTLLLPSSGAMRVCGFDPVTESMDVRARLGYMPDFFGIYDDLRVDEYLEFFAAAYGIPANKRTGLADDLLDLVDLAGKRESSVNSLSRGMKQRLCLARALVHDPELLILDEPASGLDPRARIDLRELMLELRRMGKTILISSHILSELQEVCSHVAILEAGELIAYGDPKTLLTDAAAARRFQVRLAGDHAEALARAVAGMDDVELIRDETRGIALDIVGDDERAAEVLAAVVGAGVPVTGFAEDEAGIEELFMRVTKGIVR